MWRKSLYVVDTLAVVYRFGETKGATESKISSFVSVAINAALVDPVGIALSVVGLLLDSDLLNTVHIAYNMHRLLRDPIVWQAEWTGAFRQESGDRAEPDRIAVIDAIVDDPHLNTASFLTQVVDQNVASLVPEDIRASRSDLVDYLYERRHDVHNDQPLLWILFQYTANERRNAVMADGEGMQFNMSVLENATFSDDDEDESAYIDSDGGYEGDVFDQ